MAVHDGIPQIYRAGHGRVLGEIAVNGADGRILDVFRRGEVRLAGAEVHDVNALGAEFFGFRYHRHGGGGLDPVDAFGEFHCFHGCRAHAFLFLFLGTSINRASCSLKAGSSFSFNFCSTTSGTNPLTGPPAWATSRTSRELT